MKKSNISWEIVLAGIAFIAIGIYLFNRGGDIETESSAVVWHSKPHVPAPPSPPSLPGAIVIDLDNLESLKNLKDLENLKNMENLEHLEIELKNLDKLIEKHTGETAQESVEKSLQELETELQKIEKADFKVKLQNQKLFINKNYNVDEAKWTEVSSGVYVFRESFSIPDLKSMDLKLSFGNINIVGSDDQQSEITLRATGSVEDPANFSKQIDIEKSFSSPGATFRVASADNSNISDHVNLEATLTIPKETQLNAHTSGGHINASSMSNNQHFQTSGGHIQLNSIEGKTIAKTHGGHITIDQISGNTVLATGGGHIKVTESDGSLTAKTGGGHIEIQDASGSIIAKTSGGNISTTMQKATGPLKFFTSAGNISLYLPADITANLDISGSTVSLAEAFSFSGSKTKGNISGSINGGGLPVVVNCGYGNVNISSNE